MMDKLKLYSSICSLFPPIISQSIRNRIFPLAKARKLQIDFSKASITGSIYYGNTLDDHSYRFAIHGFFDWRNIIIAKRYSEYFKGDIIEIGANVGTETISYCDIASSKWKVHAFEPLPENLQELEILRKSMGNLVLYPYAVSNKIAKVNFQTPPLHESGIGKIIHTDNDEIIKETLLVESLPLDSYINDLDAISLISIDVEGHEHFVLEGAKEIFKKFKPAVIIEVSPKLLERYSKASSNEILSFFNDLDYSCFTIGRYTLDNVNINSLQMRKSVNWFCLPKENKEIVSSIKKDLKLRAFVPWYLLKSLKLN